MSRRVKVSKLKEAIRHLVLQELNEQENDKPEHFGGGENIDILGYKTKHFDICKSAVILYQKLMEKDLSDEAKELIISSAKELDHLFEMEKQVVNGEEVDHDPVEHGIELTNIISFQLGRVAEMIGEDFERDTNFIKLHVMEIVKRHKREVDEASTTYSAGVAPGGPGHYFTPYAFSGGRKKDKKKRKKISRAAGYKPVNESQPFADFTQFPKLSRAQQESLDELFGFAESYQIYNAFEKDPKKFIKTLDDMANIRKASNKKPKGVNFNKGKKQFVKEVMKPAVKKALKQKGYGPIFQAIDNSKRQLKQLKYSRGEIQDTLIGMFGNEDPKILQKINEGYGEMMDELEKIYRPTGAPPIAKEALKDLADEYDIGRVLYAARTNKKSFMEVMDMKIDQLQSQFVNKKHINTIKRGKKLREGRYHDWRNDESMTPKQKIGRSMREIRDALNELDKTVKMNLKLKTELKMKSEDYWKNTHKALTKISERLVKMANKVGNLK